MELRIQVHNSNLNTRFLNLKEQLRVFSISTNDKSYSKVNDSKWTKVIWLSQVPCQEQMSWLQQIPSQLQSPV